MKTLSKIRNLLIISSILTCTKTYSQNVAINGTGALPNASAMLDITSTSSGLLMPRMTSAQRTAIATPATGLTVYDLTTQSFWYFNGIIWVQQTSNLTGWLIAGNTLAADGILGSLNNYNVKMFANGSELMRLTSGGQIVIGSTTPSAGDLLGAFSNGTNTWALNGYSSFNGGGVYGLIQAGNSTNFSAVQGQYFGSSTQGVGILGTSASTSGGTAFNAVGAGVSGDASGVRGNYAFGVLGNGGSYKRTGGVMGYDYGTMGALGYFANNSTNYSVYGFGTGFTTGGAGGRISSSSVANITSSYNVPDNTIGLGIYGGVMGGWIKGLVYGTHFSGHRYGIYVDGNTITNNVYTQLNSVDNSDKRVATYAPTSTNVDVYSKGKANLVNGKTIVNFDNNFKNLISDKEDVIITLTPVGVCNGVYISRTNLDGFEVTENNNGNSNVQFNWIAIGTKKGFENPQISSEIIDASFDGKMNGVMHNDNAPDEGTPIWWDGTSVRFDTPQAPKGAPAVINARFNNLSNKTKK
ncbi:MAG: hypothetical protein JSU07_06705 [Bacteroidetes bacterium]|nr:hypothetical protein [Bacteroidota bacterium]